MVRLVEGYEALLSSKNGCIVLSKLLEKDRNFSISFAMCMDLMSSPARLQLMLSNSHLAMV